ncbi:protein-glutamate O-methyltransferase CheR [Halorussus sp. MSC15.2]|uniref:CheR family methyltransferase n=1 Tax=Halorussus sp. MSC15.2 TaxID=2283638 RepID=UPI0013D2825F|nr:protein-glutamate O-methyltransferase CheR [Halorussus sp. MSC15.2]NEU56477.1 protein-glutamate O-methyltransferase CheR [Halorussus sp. MSC15.2]
MTPDDEAFEELLDYVESELGFATSYYDDAYLDRRVSSRMRRSDTDDYAEYHDLLSGDEREQEALLDAFSVNVTSFFRNPEVWEEMRSVIRALSEERSRIRLWSAACSDGREPYSMSMLALDDPEVDDSRIRITATDIDREILAAARQGVYENTRTTDIGEQLAPLDEYERYVERDGDQFAVADAVKELVSFERHDLINGDPKSNFDLVVCRNLFIYIDTEHKLPILETVSKSLSEGGYLVIGKTETLPELLKPAFEPIARRLRIYRKIDSIPDRS